ncbi:MAG: hypothetical protein STSR0008_24580 [Ignavibacterium sp.]
MEIENKKLTKEKPPEDIHGEITIEDKKLILNYIEYFINNDFMNVVYYCDSWVGKNGKSFRSVLPKDLVMKVLELINEGRRKCYITSYQHFKGSVYYHVKNELRTLFNYKKKDDITEDSPENYFTIIDAENYFDEGNYVDESEDILTKIENNELKEKLLNLFNSDDEVFEYSVLEKILENYKRNEIAEELGLSEKEVTNIQKRIFRKMKKNKNQFIN